MLSFLIRSKTLRHLLELFFSRPTEHFYLREIERLTGDPVGALQRQLHLLEKGGLFKSKRVGPLRYFSLDQNYAYLAELQSLITKELRHKQLKQTLKKLLRRLKRNYAPIKVILFGSLAHDRITPESDIDLIIIKKNLPPRYWDRVKELAPLLSDLDIGVDVTLWTPEEWDRESRTNRFIQEEILKNGKVIYEQAA